MTNFAIIIQYCKTTVWRIIAWHCLSSSEFSGKVWRSSVRSTESRVEQDCRQDFSALCNKEKETAATGQDGAGLTGPLHYDYIRHTTLQRVRRETTMPDEMQLLLSVTHGVKFGRPWRHLGRVTGMLVLGHEPVNLEQLVNSSPQDIPEQDTCILGNWWYRSTICMITINDMMNWHKLLFLTS